MKRKQFEAIVHAVRSNMSDAKMEARLLNFQVAKINRMLAEHKKNG